MRVDAGPGENGHLGAHLLRQAAMRAATVAGIFAFGILAHDHPIEIIRPDITERRGNSRQNFRRPHIRILVEALADRQPQAPERHMVRHIRRTHRTEKNRVEFFQSREAVIRHHDAMLFVIVRSPVEIGELQRQAFHAFLQASQHRHAGGDHFRPDTVGRNCGDIILAHMTSLVISLRRTYKAAA